MASPTEDVYALGDAQTEGFPVRYASPGFEKLFGFKGPEVAWQRCGDVVGGPAILRDSKALFAAAAFTHRAIDDVQDRLRFLGEQCCEACRAMMAEPGLNLGAALALNRKASGDFFVAELLFLNLKHPTIGWSYCLGFQRDITSDVSAETLMANCSSGAYARLMGTRSEEIKRRREIICEEKFIQELHLKALSVFSLDLWRTLRSELLSITPGRRCGDGEAELRQLTLAMPTGADAQDEAEQSAPPKIEELEQPFSLSLRQPGGSAQATPAKAEEPFSLSLSKPVPQTPSAMVQAAAAAPRAVLTKKLVPPQATHRASSPPAAPCVAAAVPRSGQVASTLPSRTSSGASGGVGMTPVRTTCSSVSLLQQHAVGPATPANTDDGFSRRSTASTVRTLSPPSPMEPDVDAASEASSKCPSAITRSWDAVQAVGVEEVGETMLRNFFDLCPDVEDIFTDPQLCAKYWDWDWSMNQRAEPTACVRPGLRKLSAKILNIVGCAVAGQHDIQKLMPTLMSLGMRHVNYGAREEHFPVLGRAMLEAVRERVGEDIFTAEVEHAWEVVFNFVAAALQGGLMAGRASVGATGKKPLLQPQPMSDQAIKKKAALASPAHGADAGCKNTLLQHLHSN